MNIDIIENRKSPPEAWQEGDNIPWHDPEFSGRMLREHLSQDHDAASRRLDLIEKQINWIESELIPPKKTKILDLCCGPGLYAYALAKKGHECHGIDYSPASIEYAADQANIESLDIRYQCEDVRLAGYGSGYDLVMMIYGEFNVFHPVKIKQILKKAIAALKPGGKILCDVHSFGAIKKIGSDLSTWFSSSSGLFSDRPHLVLSDSYFDEKLNCATKRFYMIESDNDVIAKYGVTYQAYSEEEYISLFEESGFNSINIMKYPERFKEAEGIGLQFIVGDKL